MTVERVEINSRRNFTEQKAPVCVSVCMWLQTSRGGSHGSSVNPVTLLAQRKSWSLIYGRDETHRFDIYEPKTSLKMCGNSSQAPDCPQCGSSVSTVTSVNCCVCLFGFLWWLHLLCVQTSSCNSLNKATANETKIWMKDGRWSLCDLVFLFLIAALLQMNQRAAVATRWTPEGPLY